MGLVKDKMEKILQKKTVLIVGDKKICEQIKFHHMKKVDRPKIVLVTTEHPSFETCLKLAKVNASANINVLWIFPFLWELIHNDNVGKPFYKVSAPFSVKKFVSAVKEADIQLKSKCKNLQICWTVPYLPNLIYLNEGGNLFETFNNLRILCLLIPELSNGLKKNMNLICLNLNDLLFTNQNKMLQDFTSNPKSMNFKFPENKVIDGFIPNQFFVKAIIDSFVEKISDYSFFDFSSNSICSFNLPADSSTNFIEKPKKKKLTPYDDEFSLEYDSEGVPKMIPNPYENSKNTLVPYDDDDDELNLENESIAYDSEGVPKMVPNPFEDPNKPPLPRKLKETEGQDQKSTHTNQQQENSFQNQNMGGIAVNYNNLISHFPSNVNMNQNNSAGSIANYNIQNQSFYMNQNLVAPQIMPNLYVNPGHSYVSQMNMIPNPYTYNPTPGTLQANVNSYMSQSMVSNSYTNIPIGNAVQANVNSIVNQPTLIQNSYTIDQTANVTNSVPNIIPSSCTNTAANFMDILNSGVLDTVKNALQFLNTKSQNTASISQEEEYHMNKIQQKQELHNMVENIRNEKSDKSKDIDSEMQMKTENASEKNTIASLKDSNEENNKCDEVVKPKVSYPSTEFYRKNLTSFFVGPLWRNLFLYGGIDTATFAIDRFLCCMKGATKRRGGLHLIVATSDLELIESAKALPDVVDKTVGLNEDISYGTPSVLIDTPEVLHAQICDSRVGMFRSVTNVAALFAYGDEIFDKSQSLHDFFQKIVKYLQTNLPNKDGLHTVIISPTASDDIKREAEKTMEHFLFSPIHVKQFKAGPALNTNPLEGQQCPPSSAVSNETKASSGKLILAPPATPPLEEKQSISEVLSEVQNKETIIDALYQILRESDSRSTIGTTTAILTGLLEEVEKNKYYAEPSKFSECLPRRFQKSSRASKSRSRSKSKTKKKSKKRRRRRSRSHSSSSIDFSLSPSPDNINKRLKGVFSPTPSPESTPKRIQKHRISVENISDADNDADSLPSIPLLSLNNENKSSKNDNVNADNDNLNPKNDTLNAKNDNLIVKSDINSKIDNKSDKIEQKSDRDIAKSDNNSAESDSKTSKPDEKSKNSDLENKSTKSDEKNVKSSDLSDKLNKLNSLARKYVTDQSSKEAKIQEEEFIEFLTPMGKPALDDFSSEVYLRQMRHDLEFKDYISNPQSHFKCKEKYNLFLSKFNELFVQDLHPPDAQDTWLCFWQNYIEDIKESSWIEKKKEIYKEFRERYKRIPGENERRKRDKKAEKLLGDIKQKEREKMYRNFNKHVETPEKEKTTVKHKELKHEKMFEENALTAAKNIPKLLNLKPKLMDRLGNKITTGPAMSRHSAKNDFGFTKKVLKDALSSSKEQHSAIELDFEKNSMNKNLKGNSQQNRIDNSKEYGYQNFGKKSSNRNAVWEKNVVQNIDLRNKISNSFLRKKIKKENALYKKLFSEEQPQKTVKSTIVIPNKDEASARSEEFNLKACLSDLRLVVKDTRILGVALDSLLDKSLQKKSIEEFRASENVLLIDTIKIKLECLINTCEPRETIKYKNAMAAIDKIKIKLKETVKSRQSQPSTSSARSEKTKNEQDDFDYKAIARETFGCDTQAMYTIIKNIFKVQKLNEPTDEQVDLMFKKISEIHFKMAMQAI